VAASVAYRPRNGVDAAPDAFQIYGVQKAQRCAPCEGNAGDHALRTDQKNIFAAGRSGRIRAVLRRSHAKNGSFELLGSRGDDDPRPRHGTGEPLEIAEVFRTERQGGERVHERARTGESEADTIHAASRNDQRFEQVIEVSRLKLRRAPAPPASRTISARPAADRVTAHSGASIRARMTV
jgi:hypothetical protein